MEASRPIAPGYGIVPADEGEGLLPWAWAEERLRASRSYWLGTAAGTTPHAMPVWGVWSGGCFYFSTGEGSKKARNLAANAACTITTERADEAVVVEGIASLAPVDDAFAAARDAYRAKYAWELDAPIGRVYVVRPRKVFGFIDHESRFGASATRWIFR